MEIIGKLTGATIERSLAQYSEVYGEILLGMHRDMERHQSLINEHDQNMRQGVVLVSQVQGQLSQAVTQAEAHSKNASRCLEQARSAALAAGGSARETKEDMEKTREFLNDAQQKWQALLSSIETQKNEIRALDLAFNRFRTRVMWSSAVVALLLIIGGLAWMIHFVR